MFKSVWITFSVGARSCLAVGGCAGSNSNAQHRGVEVTVVNSNLSDVMVYESPTGKPTKIVGCRNPSCPEPKPREDIATHLNELTRPPVLVAIALTSSS